MSGFAWWENRQADGGAAGAGAAAAGAAGAGAAEAAAGAGKTEHSESDTVRVDELSLEQQDPDVGGKVAKVEQDQAVKGRQEEAGPEFTSTEKQGKAVEDWKDVSDEMKERLSSMGISIVVDPIKGRCLLAKKRFHAGSLVLSQEAMALSPCPDGWSVCRRRRGVKLTPLVTMMGRILDRSSRQQAGGEEEQVGSRVKDFHALASHYGKHEQESMVGFTHVALSLREYMMGDRKAKEEEEEEEDGGGLNMRQVVEDICRLSSNCYTIVDEEERASFRGRSMQLRALKDIEEGEELSLSYVDPAEPLAVRQEELRRRYFFSCSCFLCAGEGAKAEDEEKTRVLAGSSREAEKRVDGLLRMAREAAGAPARPETVLEQQLDAIKAAELVLGPHNVKLLRAREEALAVSIEV
ncbi:hypothetical protein GUITHDRAFT_99460 [Guillardia theta CCMP2712]|uniref:SET domain-containing protein n=1 Tax=Guillardia theta (strain CCMP2712) TaxID=905079 RepID=L1K302_GUITC|nr:hypothetical protein GUITHDRAFT_99460 [Guillardia theta CCMP2712]EKX54810.1 hypothetical protein GUITHDRAFT_99460 [Guillardia theta CCMP2712]|eukprot:XP_005841790.1 hypothetical protein GUITHDRAFT_99460 [Guillardia theta CCMP2712]